MTTPSQQHEDGTLEPPSAIPLESADVERQSNASHDEDQATVLDTQTQDPYARFSPSRKLGIVTTLCFCGFVTPISSTALLVAIPEIATALHTTSVVVNVSNALFFVSMAVSPLFWGPLATCLGRRRVFLVCSVVMAACSVGTAAAPNLPAFVVFRMLTAFQGTAYLVVGSVVIGDIYPPTERGRALSWFMTGILVGPTIAPFIGGVVISFTSWRVIFWILTGLCLVATVLVVFLLPETIHERKPLSTQGGVMNSALELAYLVNPMVVLKPLFTYPNLWIVALAVSSLIWNQYSLLTPIRHVLNPRFNLTSPLQSSLFYLAPGSGYLFGSLFGGTWSDYMVARYMHKRGRRVPEDRLRAAVLVMMVVVPACMIVYGWSIEKRVGGIPLVVIVMFLQGFTQLFCMPSLNTYCIDVMQDKGQSSVVVAGNYLSRFMFAAGGTAVCLPAIEAIGVGWFSTVSGLFISVTGGMTLLLTIHGEKWRQSRGS